MIQDESDEEIVNLAHIPHAEDVDVDSDRGLDTNEEDDDKKKLGFKTTYEGFSIWGWVLCLFVERKGGPKKQASELGPNSQALMQEWIASTQEQKDDDF